MFIIKNYFMPDSSESGTSPVSLVSTDETSPVLSDFESEGQDEDFEDDWNDDDELEDSALDEIALLRRRRRRIPIIVNGQDKRLDRGVRTLSYEDAVILAYGNCADSDSVIYTVTYSNGPKKNRKGILVKGESVRVRKGMIFNVSRSDKS